MVLVGRPTPEQFALVESISHELTDSRVREAFLHIPRHECVSAYYERLPSEGREKAQWKHVERSKMSEAQWRQQIYQDRWLITRLDRTGLPASSSSDPTVMARMLSSLHIQPGMRVLEIGTGTGYNAALIAYLTGSPGYITTLEVVPDLVREAKECIKHVIGPGMHIICADGRKGYEKHAPYDRIIATGSVPIIPQPWLDQLATGGLLLMNLQSTLVNVMLLIAKQPDGSASGIVPYEGVFMGLHDGSGERRITDYPVPRDERGPTLGPKLGPISEGSVFPEELKRNYDLRLFLYCHFPRLQRFRHWQADVPVDYLADYQKGTPPRFVQFYRHEVRGHASLWEEVRPVGEKWKQAGEPTPSAYRFTFAQGEHRAHLNGQTWILRKSRGGS
jgi:protein-L-isoaspartate(D-aspartate) O-methyltransferase